jgi:hypothetical protein
VLISWTVPSFLEDRATFVKERANGLYGPTAFMLSNFIIGLPYLCMSLPPLTSAKTNELASRHICSLLDNRLLAI